MTSSCAPAASSVPLASWVGEVDMSLLCVTVPDAGEDIKRGSQLLVAEHAAQLGVELVGMGLAPLEMFLALRGQLDAPDPMVIHLADPPDQTLCLQPVQVMGQGGA